MKALPIILVILKYSGALGAAIYGVYATVTEFKQDRTIGDRTVRVLSKAGYWGIAFLVLVSLLNLGASGVEDYTDKVDRNIRQQELTRRFERLSHPLGTIILKPTFQLSLQGETLHSVGEQLFAWSDSIPNDYPPGQTPPQIPLPKPKSEAYRAFLASVDMEFTFSTKGISKDKLSIGNMSFKATSSANKRTRCDTPLTGFVLEGRCFDVASDEHNIPMVIFGDSPIKNNAENRYSDGEIISITDLLGSTMRIRLCPFLLSRDVADNFSLKALEIMFPGQQILTLGNELKRTVDSDCSVYSYVFPDRIEALLKLLQFNTDDPDLERLIQ